MAASEATGRGDTASAAEFRHAGPELGYCALHSEGTIIGQGFRLFALQKADRLRKRRIHGNFLGKGVGKDTTETRQLFDSTCIYF
jgi:hypothetical protein